jgi:hypothetical protein
MLTGPRLTLSAATLKLPAGNRHGVSEELLISSHGIERQMFVGFVRVGLTMRHLRP